ncbi:hypothetical protein Ddye_008034 [Dipteronia dyeriana]|uniref:GDSL esterase/lipase n=1 Tax=Dipteronia dyeriana TaxID=168575 RepID=A0AAD9X918_9ROSI|nr:hypothetical protein Ddye_008034 [Dipteronia dyeriana]
MFVPALIIFGDSIVDVGNNNNLNTVIKANFPPYGRDFVTHRPTGRFCNGKLATDFTAEFIGFTSCPPAYLTQEAKGERILTGVNFATAASGLYDGTAQLYSAISLTQQLNSYRECQNKVVSMVGREMANNIFTGAIHLLSAGSSDFIQNYYISPLLNRVYSPDRFSDTLMNSYSSFVQNLYQLGVRKLGMTSLPPTGCLPAVVTLFGGGSNQCVARLNQDAISFNNKLNSASQSLVNKLPGLKLVVFNIYKPLLDIITTPGKSGNGSLSQERPVVRLALWRPRFYAMPGPLGTCSNATQYVFWDGFHPSEAANRVLAGVLLEKGFDLIS